MKSREKKASIWTFAIAIIMVHFAAYFGNYFGPDQLVPCVLAYFAIAVILISTIDDDNETEISVTDRSNHDLLDLQLQENKPLNCN
jgi:hypothetical protein